MQGHTNKNQTTKLTSLTMGTSDVTLYALYKTEPITYTATTKRNVATDKTFFIDIPPFVKSGLIFIIPLFVVIENFFLKFVSPVPAPVGHSRTISRFALRRSAARSTPRRHRMQG